MQYLTFDYQQLAYEMMADHGTGRREKITTTDFKEDIRACVPTADIQATRLANISGVEENRIARKASPLSLYDNEDQLLNHKMKSEIHIYCDVCRHDFRSKAGCDKHVLLVGHTKVCCEVPPKIIHPITHKILLLKRSPAEKFFAYHWEIPGGKVDDTDKTIWDALKRELYVETGLSIKKLDIT